MAVEGGAGSLSLQPFAVQPQRHERGRDQRAVPCHLLCCGSNRRELQVFIVPADTAILAVAAAVATVATVAAANNRSQPAGPARR